jgi:predicted AlkP superfamily pyrophosphatase or phosphodiesterase
MKRNYGTNENCGKYYVKPGITPLIFVIFVYSVSSVVSPVPAAQSAQRPPVVLIAIDGLKPDYVLEADRHRLGIPNLRRFVSEGAYSTGVTGVLPTVTYPSHTTLVTGASPARHGIVSNTPFDPSAQNMGGWYWYTEDFKVPALWDAARRAGLVTASVDWPATVGADINYNIPQFWRAGTLYDRKLLRQVSTPGLLNEIEAVVGPYPEGKDYSIRADEIRAEFNLYLLERKRPDLQLVYFGGLDHEQHDYGPDSKQAYAGLERIDALVGRVRAAAEKLGGGSAVVCIVSDHGFAATGKELRLNAALKEAGLIELDAWGRMKEWRAMAWSSGGSAAVMLKDAKDEQTRRKVKDLLAQMSADAANGIFRVYEESDLPRLGGFPGAAFVVGAKPGWYIGGGFDGPLVRDTKPGGTHGYLPELGEMNSSFFIVGPHIPAGRNLGPIDMRDIAPTLAGFLGVSLPQAEGRDVLR